MAEAERHCAAGIRVWDWAGTGGGDPDVVFGCCGDVLTMEVLAAVSLLREHAPGLKVRVVNVVDLMKLQPATEHPHGLTDPAFDDLFTTDRPILFNFHGYPWLIHRLAYRRTNHRNLHVRGYKEEGTTTTPFDMCVLNQVDRFNLINDVAGRVPAAARWADSLRGLVKAKLAEHRRYIAEHGVDLPEVGGWAWGGRGQAPVGSAARDTAADHS